MFQLTQKDIQDLRKLRFKPELTTDMYMDRWFNFYTSDFKLKYEAYYYIHVIATANYGEGISTGFIPTIDPSETVEEIVKFHDILYRDFIDNRRWVEFNKTIEQYAKMLSQIHIGETMEDVIKEFMQYTKFDKELSKRFFNRECTKCGISLLAHEVGISLKMFGRQTLKVFCSECILGELEVTSTQLENMRNSFKKGGCKLV
jgi:tRNA G10  N-methylase Trm11